MTTRLERSTYASNSFPLNGDHTARNKSVTLSTAVELFIANRRLEKIAELLTKPASPDQTLKNYFNSSYKSSVAAFKDKVIFLQHTKRRALQIQAKLSASSQQEVSSSLAFMHCASP